MTGAGPGGRSPTGDRPAQPAQPGQPGQPGQPATPEFSIAAFQRAIEGTFLERDRRRGAAGTFLWFAEEVGELARAIKKGEHANLEEEFGDVLAWLSTLASLSGIDLAKAAEVYRDGCPTCHARPCSCPFRPLAV